MAKTLCSQCRGYWFDPKPENKILQATTKTQYYQNKLKMLLNKYIFFNVKKKSNLELPMENLKEIPRHRGRGEP